MKINEFIKFKKREFGYSYKDIVEKSNNLLNERHVKQLASKSSENVIPTMPTLDGLALAFEMTVTEVLIALNLINKEELSSLYFSSNNEIKSLINAESFLKSINDYYTINNEEIPFDLDSISKKEANKIASKIIQYINDITNNKD